MKVKSESNDKVLGFMEASTQLIKHFGCDSDFFLKPLVDLEWAIRSEDDFHFLSYWGEDGKKIEAVIVRKNGDPMIFRNDGYAMIVAIDCVKIGFIFQVSKEIGK